MKRISDILLRKYDPEEAEYFLKTKFIIHSTPYLIAGFFLAIIYSSSISPGINGIVLAEITGLSVIVLSLFVLAKGQLNRAIHMILLSCFGTVWVSIFLKSNVSLIARMDTFVYIVGLLSSVPILLLKSRKPMIFYFCGNAFFFSIFIAHLYTSTNLPAMELLDYGFDNAFAMVLIFFISFNIYSINQQAFHALKTELDNHKKAEKALFETNNKLSAHLMNTPVGVIHWDLDFRISEWNPSAEAIFGYTRNDIIGEPISKLFLHLNKNEDINQVFNDLLSGTGGKRHLNEGITKNGSLVICDWYNNLLENIDGEIIGGASLVNDVTEREKTLERLAQSEKMMSLGGLAAGMAHEINNPLAGIMQNSQVACNRLSKEVPANSRIAEELGTSMATIRRFAEKRNVLKQLENVRHAGGHIRDIVENMLSFSRKSSSIRTEVCLEKLIDDTLQLARNHYNPDKGYDFRNLDIIREYGSDIPAIYCERSKIQQVLLNLFKNASQAMGRGSSSNNRAHPTLTLRLNPQKRYVNIEIEDNGPGMTPEVSSRIFEPFFTTNAENDGTGLGLSISYFIIVDGHGGQMAVNSREGEGTRFTIKLPIRTDRI